MKSIWFTLTVMVILLPFLTACVSLEVGLPLPAYNTERIGVPDTLRGHVLPPPPHGVRPPLRGEMDSLPTTTAKRVLGIRSSEAPVGALDDAGIFHMLLTGRRRLAKALHPGDTVQVHGAALGPVPLAGTVESVGPMVPGTARAGQVVVRLVTYPQGVVPAQAPIMVVRVATHEVQR